MPPLDKDTIRRIELLAEKKKRQTPINVKLVNPISLTFEKGANPKGEYTPGESYKPGDTVIHEGATWMALQDTDDAPGNQNWQLFVPRGDKGDKGDKGDTGPQGPQGLTGAAGRDGRDGAEGKPGERGPAGPRGLQGPTGPRGERGERGPQGEKGEAGERGERGPRGLSGVIGTTGKGVPAGGSTNQVLRKKSNDDYDTEWATPSGGSGGAVDSVNGATGAVVLDQDDIADGTTYKQYSQTEKTKLAGIAAGATANDTDANLRDRSTHTGTQAISTVTGLQTALDGKAASTHTHAQADVTNLTSDLAGKQPLDADLTAIAALSPVNDDVLQRKAGAWTNRTTTQLKTDLALTKGDVGLGNVDNTSDANKPVSTATQTALDGKQPLDSDLTAIASLSPSNDDIVQRKAGAWVARTMAQLKTDLALTKSDVGLGNVDDTSDATKNSASAILTNKTVDLTNNTLVGSVAEFNAALESADFYTTGGTDVALADGGTGASLADPNADRILFWDDSAGAVTWLAPGSNLSITGTTIDATGGGGATTGKADLLYLSTITI